MNWLNKIIGKGDPAEALPTRALPAAADGADKRGPLSCVAV